MSTTPSRIRWALCLAVLVLVSSAWRQAGAATHAPVSRTGQSRTAVAPTTATAPAPIAPTAGPTRRSTPVAPPSTIAAITGLILGGVVGRLLYPEMNHGVGLLELLLAGGCLYGAVGLLRRVRHASRRGRAAAAKPARPTRERASVHDSELAPMDESFDHVAVVETAKQVLGSVKSAMALRDAGLVSDRLTPRMQALLGARCEDLRRQGRHERTGRIEIGRAEITRVWREGDQQYARIRLAGRAIKAGVDDATMRIVSGSETEPQPFDELWTFTRPAGAARWRADGVEALDAAAPGQPHTAGTGAASGAKRTVRALEEVEL